MTRAGYLGVVAGLLIGFAGACGRGDVGFRERPTRLLGGGTTLEHPFVRTVPFRLVQNTIVVGARLNEAADDDDFVVDSGAPLTLSESLARRLRLSILAHIDIAGPESNVLSVPVTRVDRIEIGGVGFEKIGGVIAPIAPPNPLACLSPNGLLGASLLHTAIWQIDFDRRLLTITSDLEHLDHVADADRIPFTRSDAAGSPRIAVQVNTTPDASLLVDLGFNGSLAIPRQLYERTGNALTTQMPRGRGGATATVLGESASTLRIGRLQTLRIGTLVLHDFPVVTGSTVSDFHVGVDFLRHFVVTLDWKNGDLYLRPREAAEALHPRFESYGFVPALQDGALVVGFLWDDSAAARSGMRLGERLVEIDGRNVTQPEFEQFCDLLSTIGLFGQGTSRIEVAARRGARVHRWRLARTALLD